MLETIALVYLLISLGYLSIIFKNKLFIDRFLKYSLLIGFFIGSYDFIHSIKYLGSHNEILFFMLFILNTGVSILFLFKINNNFIKIVSLLGLISLGLYYI